MKVLLVLWGFSKEVDVPAADTEIVHRIDFGDGVVDGHFKVVAGAGTGMPVYTLHKPLTRWKLR